ncbi:MAG: gamma-glutamyltransferase family protein [Chloroflexota bacterium]
MNDGPWVPVPVARGTRGAVVAPHHLATAAGLEVLAAGGTAVDAAIATNAVLAVVMPNGGGIGGDAFWLIWDAREGRQHGLNGSGRAPAAADRQALVDAGHRRIPLHGPLAITVPGAVRSWGDAHDRFGRLSRAAILGPAIDLARGGFPAWHGLIDAVEVTAPKARDALGPSADFLAVYRPHERPWRPGELVRFKPLAATLERLALDGFDAFYEGDLADRQAVALAEAGSAISADDLRNHRSTWTEPIGFDYRGVEVTTHAPNSSGVVALELLSILAGFEPPAPEAFGPAGPVDAGWIHRGIEAAKLAMADRDRFLGDPDFVDVPLDRLLDPAYGRELATGIDPERASLPRRAGHPSEGDTVYMATVDAEGNAVSLIESNYIGFGCLVVDPVTGIHYHDRGAYFSLEPDHPDRLEPGKRPLHTLLPGMLFRPPGDGPSGAARAPWIVCGSMGGDAQPQVFAQVVSALVDGRADVHAAVSVPRWFVQPPEHFSPPIEVLAEPRFSPGILEALAALGHPVREALPFDGLLGHAHAIELVDGGPAADGGSVAAATDPRSAGLPAVR